MFGKPFLKIDMNAPSVRADGRNVSGPGGGCEITSQGESYMRHVPCGRAQRSSAVPSLPWAGDCSPRTGCPSSTRCFKVVPSDREGPQALCSVHMIFAGSCSETSTSSGPWIILTYGCKSTLSIFQGGFARVPFPAQLLNWEVTVFSIFMCCSGSLLRALFKRTATIAEHGIHLPSFNGLSFLCGCCWHICPSLKSLQGWWLLLFRAAWYHV